MIIPPEGRLSYRYREKNVTPDRRQRPFETRFLQDKSPGQIPAGALLCGRTLVGSKLHPSLVLVVSAVLGLAWHIYATEAKPTDQQGQRPHGVPKWSFTAAIALPDGSFEILH